MKKVFLKDIKIKPLIETIERKKISDEEYFSEKYKDYTSNSKLRYINYSQDGCPSLYKNGIQKETSKSLLLGSAVHQLTLEPESFSLAEDLQKPSAKLGEVIDEIINNRKLNKSIYDSIVEACIKVGYYVNSLSKNRISQIISKGLYYYIHSKSVSSDSIVLSSKDRDVCIKCVESLKNHVGISKTLRPTDDFGDPIEAYNEDSFFLDFKCSYKGKTSIIKFKMKADNWTIDPEAKKLTLNDLKTTSKLLSFFMHESGSFVHYHYARQMSLYLYVLFLYVKKTYNADKTWNIVANMIVVETGGEHKSGMFRVSRAQLNEGKREFQQLLKMVGYCEINGYSDDVEFI